MTTDHRDSVPSSPQRDESGVIPLSSMHSGERGEVVALNGGRALLGRMTALGFTPGAEVAVIQNFGHGPLIVLVRDGRVALGRGEAGKVCVRRWGR